MFNANHIVARDLGLLIIRLMPGLAFAFHGAQKLFGMFGGHGLDATAGWMESVGIPFPASSAVLAGSAEFFGGLSLITGLGARWMCLPLAFTMLVATTTLSGFDVRASGMEYALTLGMVSAGLFLTGPGSLVLRIPRAHQAEPRATGIGSGQ